MKIKANPSLPYSILNPDTNSDSPSAKSKGVRLVSAKHEINQIPTIGRSTRYENRVNFYPYYYIQKNNCYPSGKNNFFKWYQYTRN